MSKTPPQQTVAITGASSFTALWIAKEIAAQGYKVHALVRGQVSHYSGLKALRLRQLKNWAQIHEGLSAETGGFAQWINTHKPNIWIHHHHEMENFRLPSYDSEKADRIALEPMPEILAALKESGCRGIVYSGTYFEPGEAGAQPEPTPYAQSKARVWQKLLELGGPLNLRISKVVIPNPVGPLENEDRLIPTLIDSAQKRKPFVIRTPDSMAQNLSVLELGESYVATTDELLFGRTRILRPQGWQGTTARWANIVNDGLVKRHLGLPPCEIQWATEPKASAKYTVSDVTEWDPFWAFYKQILSESGLLGASPKN